MSVDKAFDYKESFHLNKSARATREEALSEIFSSRATARSAEQRADNGDDQAMVEMWKFYSQGYEILEDVGGSLPQFDYDIYRVGLKEAEDYARQAKAVGNLGADLFHEQVNKGGSRISRRGYRIVQNPFNILPASGSMYEVDTSAGRGPYKKINLIDHQTKPAELVDAYQRIGSYAIPALIECAKAGDPYAASELTGLHNQDRIAFKTKGFLNFSTSSHINNPLFSSQEADKWRDLSLALSGYDQYVSGTVQQPEGIKVQSVTALDKFIFSQDKTAEGLYNIGVALTRSDSNVPRQVYNRRIGEQDINSLAAGVDFLKHAANLGSVFAARELGDLYRDKKIQPALIAGNTATKEESVQAAAYWYNRATEIATDKEAPASINAKHRLGLLQKEFGAQDIAAYASRPEHVNPSKAHMLKYPDSIALFPKPDEYVTDFSYLNDSKLSTLQERIQRGIDDTDKTLHMLNDISESFERKIYNLGVSADDKVRFLAESEKELAASYKNNDKIIRDVNSQELQSLRAMQRWRKEQLGYGVAALLLSVAMPPVAALVGKELTTSSMLIDSIKSGVPRGASYYQAADAARIAANDKIADLMAGYKDINLSKAQMDELRQDIVKLQESVESQKLLKNSETIQELQLAYLRRQLLHLGSQNVEILDDFAKRGSDAPGSADALLEAFKPTHASSALQETFHQALTNFCFGFADSDDLHLIMAYSDSIKSPQTPEERTLKNWTEKHLKTSITEYISKANRVDALKDVGITLTSNSADLTAAIASDSKPISALVQNNFATGGNKYVSEMFAFYLTRNGNNHFHDAHLNDGVDGPVRRTPKKVKLLSDQEMRNYNEQAMLAASYGRPDFPQPDNLFLRICAAEYFETQTLSTAGKNKYVSFKDNPQAPLSYPMVHDVVNHFLEQMSLSPLVTVYREKMQNKEAVDSLIAQSFTDFFAILGHTHAEKFKEVRHKLMRSYNDQNYGSNFQFTYSKLADDAMQRYETFQEIFLNNVNKALEIGTNQQSDQLIEDLRSLKEEGATIFKLESIITPGSLAHLQSFEERSRRHSNIGKGLASGM